MSILKILGEEIKYDSDDESYELKSRKKDKELSIYQIQYIKSLFSNAGTSIKQMQADYNESNSVLNKI